MKIFSHKLNVYLPTQNTGQAPPAPHAQTGRSLRISSCSWLVSASCLPPSLLTRSVVPLPSPLPRTVSTTITPDYKVGSHCDCPVSTKSCEGPRLDTPRQLVLMILFGFEVDTLEIALREQMELVDKIFVVESNFTHKGVSVPQRYSLLTKFLA